MWQEDIDSNTVSVRASHAAEARHLHGGAMDQFHSDDFLLYAYLQTGEDEKAKAVIADSAATQARFAAMGNMGDQYMSGMFPYYQTKLPVFFDLEMRDWQSAAALEPIDGALPEAQADLVKYDSLMDEVRRGSHGYLAHSTSARIRRGEMLAWVAFAEAKPAGAADRMRESADLQDKVGQGEVDIPAREMLGDVLLASDRPREALIEYKQALRLSPNRFNGLYDAGMAAEAMGDKVQAQNFYSALLKSTGDGSRSARPEFQHMKEFAAR
jgi:tetratricopeptide (TPR) repeat protein